MKAYELPVQLDPDGKLKLPQNLVKQLPINQMIRVIFLVGESSDPEEEQTWGKLTSEQFLSGYADADSIYDREGR